MHSATPSLTGPTADLENKKSTQGYAKQGKMLFRLRFLHANWKEEWSAVLLTLDILDQKQLICRVNQSRLSNTETFCALIMFRESLYQTRIARIDSCAMRCLWKKILHNIMANKSKHFDKHLIKFMTYLSIKRWCLAMNCYHGMFI